MEFDAVIVSKFMLKVKEVYLWIRHISLYQECILFLVMCPMSMYKLSTEETFKVYLNRSFDDECFWQKMQSVSFALQYVINPWSGIKSQKSFTFECPDFSFDTCRSLSLIGYDIISLQTIQDLYFIVCVHNN